MAIRKITIPVVAQLPDDPLQMKIAQTAFDKTIAEADLALDTLLLDGWVKVGECPIALPGSLSLQIVLFKDTRERVRVPQSILEPFAGVADLLKEDFLKKFPPVGEMPAPEIVEGALIDDNSITTNDTFEISVDVESARERIRNAQHFVHTPENLADAIGKPFPTDDVLKPLHEITTPIATEGFVPRLS